MLCPALAFFPLILSCLLMIPHCASLSPDGQILLKIRKEDSRDPNNSLSNWDDSHQTPCAWKGISCDKFNTVTAVDLTGYSISGNLTSAICALPNLTVLTLHHNAFTGPFPLGLLHCKRLRKLDLSLNKFAGMLPANVSQSSELRVLNLANNAFSGIIPISFGMLLKLEALFLHDNSLSGTFPLFLGNLDSLTNFTIGSNPLHPGFIPRELGNLNKLQELRLDNCSRVGGVPPFLGNLTQLRSLDISQNLLSGVIPLSLGNLTRLKLLCLWQNNLLGAIPTFLGNLSQLEELDISLNHLRGEIPASLMALSNLQILSLRNNNLSGRIPANGSLPSTFKDCKSLRFLYIDNNQLSGEIPPGLWGAVNLQGLFLNNNKFRGKISPAIGQAKELSRLKISNNLFEGRIPAQVGQLKSLLVFEAGNNRLSGPIPRELGSLVLVNILTLDHNFLSDEIPKEIISLKNLSELNLGHNRLTGEIPALFLSHMTSLDLSNNFLSGGIPPELGASNIFVFNVSNNHLSGRIPDGLDNPAYKDNFVGNPGLCGGRNLMLPSCSSDQHNLPPHNLLRYNLPNPSNKNNALTNSMQSAASSPNYCGSSPCPPPLTALHKKVALSNDNASLEMANPGLCGGWNWMLPWCSSDQHNLPPRSLATLLSTCLVVLVVAFCSVCLYRSFCYKKPKITPLWKVTTFHSTAVNERYIFPILKEINVIGSGSAGKVYKVHLQDGEAVAVKKVRNISRSVGSLKRKSDEKESKMGEVEVNALRHIRHKNILKLLCCISSEEADFKLLVYEFMPNGSLFDRLHRQGAGEGMAGEWQIRYEIALGAARGLSYMHHDCCPPILHSDVKASNILLDEKFRAKIADFGVSRLLDSLGKAHLVSGYVGSHGYIAPEYAERLKVNEKSDVYSFGVVLLELVTGMKAMGEVEYGEDGDIVDWVYNTIHMGREKMKVLDKRMVEDNCVEQMLRVLHLGLACTNRLPNHRPSMREVLERLEASRGHSRKETVLGLERISSSHSESENEIVCFPDQQS